MQPGDLLVKFNAGYEPHVRVVVRTLWTEAERQTLSVDKLMSKVLVLSTRRGFRMAMLGVWNNGQGVFGGFTDQPRAYHIRRLLKLPKDLVLQTLHGKDSWELVDDVLMGLEAELTLTTDTYTEQPDHWIPNTGEMLPIEKITIKGQYPLGTKPLSQEEKEVVLLGPADPYYEEQPEDHPAGSNIYRNQGTGLGFYGYFTDNITPVLIASFERKQDWVYDEKDSPYQVVYDAAFSDDGGTSLREGCRFVTGLDGTLFFYNDTGLSATRFGVKPLGEGAEIRPGDDYLLRFGVAIDSDIRGKAREGEFIAVYDKKLLWRANLYIAENGKDWNDEHPWDSAENEWNKRYSDTNLNTIEINDMDLDSMSDGDGGQVIDIFPYTPVRTVGGTTENPNAQNYVEDRVAYDYPQDENGSFLILWSLDSPFDFNYKMIKQRDIIQSKYAGEQASPFAGISLNSLQNWNTTKAPTNKWQNYVHGTVNGEAPYLPGLGLYYFNTGNDYIEVGANPDNADLPSGADCIGFAQRTASYGGNTYTWADPPGGVAEGNEAFSFLRRYPYRNETSWKITSYDDPVGLGFANLDKIVPGDIFYFSSNGNGTSDGEHIAIVRAIEYDADSRTTSISRIELIESTFSRSIAFVINNQDIDDYSDRNWFVVRLEQ